MSIKIICADATEAMRAMLDASVDAIVCDPPYGLSKEPDIEEVLRHWLAGDDYSHKSAGFMGRKWDSFVPGPNVWREAYRVLKPGGYCLAFGGTRTYDMLVTAIRLAKFEVKDSIGYLFGSGFPKNHDVSKAIDRKAPRAGMFDEFARHFAERWEQSGLRRSDFVAHFPHYKNAESVMAQLSNWKLAKNVPSVRDFQILRQLIGLSDEWATLINRVEAEREVIGKATNGASNGSVIGLGSAAVMSREFNITAPATEAARKWQGWGSALKPAMELIVCARKPLGGGQQRVKINAAVLATWEEKRCDRA